MTVGGWMYHALNQELSLDQAMRESMARAFSRLAGRLFSFALVFMIRRRGESVTRWGR
jgi:hypothetical protein